MEPNEIIPKNQTIEDLVINMLLELFFNLMMFRHLGNFDEKFLHSKLYSAITEKHLKIFKKRIDIKQTK